MPADILSECVFMMERGLCARRANSEKAFQIRMSPVLPLNGPGFRPSQRIVIRGSFERVGLIGPPVMGNRATMAWF